MISPRQWKFDDALGLRAFLIRRSLRKREEQGPKRDAGCKTEGKEPYRITEMIDDHAGSQPAQRSANPLHRGHRTLRQIEASRPAHKVCNEQRGDGAEYPSADAIEKLYSDQPRCAVR